MIGRSGERGSGISVLPARHDDDDDAANSSHLVLVSEETNTMTKFNFSDIFQSGLQSNVHEGVLHIPQSSRTARLFCTKRK